MNIKKKSIVRFLLCGFLVSTSPILKADIGSCMAEAEKFEAQAKELFSQTGDFTYLSYVNFFRQYSHSLNNKNIVHCESGTGSSAMCTVTYTGSIGCDMLTYDSSGVLFNKSNVWNGLTRSQVFQEQVNNLVSVSPPPKVPAFKDTVCTYSQSDERNLDKYQCKLVVQ